jgi:hypothetical protein
VLIYACEVPNGPLHGDEVRSAGKAEQTCHNTTPKRKKPAYLIGGMGFLDVDRHKVRDLRHCQQGDQLGG